MYYTIVKPSIYSRLAILAAATLSVAAIAGCERAKSTDELGKVVYEMPQIPGTEEPWPLPKLKPADEDEHDHIHDHEHDHAHEHDGHGSER